MIDNLVLFSGIGLLAWVCTRALKTGREVDMAGRHVLTVIFVLLLWSYWLFDKMESSLRQYP